MIWFMFWMLFASSLGFFKLITLATVLDVSNYGKYVAIFGLSTLAGAIVSFGLIERSTKLYPRMWIEGKHSKILRDASIDMATLLMRFGLLILVGLTLTHIEKVSFNWREVVCLCLLGLSSACLCLFASLYRASSSHNALQRFTFWRSGSAFVLAIIGGYFGDWAGALSGEILASFFTSIYSIYTIHRLYAESPKGICGSEKIEDRDNEQGHGKLYVANMMTASTTMIDRQFIGSALGASAAGTYGAIMLLPQISQMIVNVVSQYIGPLIIKFVHQGHEDKSNISALWLQSGGAVLLSGLCVGVVLIGKQITFVDSFITKFSISDTSLILAGIIAAGQIYSLIEFHLIAHDCERFILAASSFSTGIFFLLFILAAQYSLSVEYFVGVGALCRWLQVVILAWAFAVNQNQTHRKNFKNSA